MNSRNKGNRNERSAAALITAWTGRKFERTPSSGGLQWKSSFSKGDIVCTVEGHKFPFCVEVKAHKEIDFSHLLNPKIKNIKVLEFWAQCLRDAEKCNKIPMLLMRYDMMPKDFFFMVLPTEFYMKLIGLRLVGTTNIQYKGKYNLTIIPSDQFFRFNYKEIKLLAKEHLQWGKKAKKK